MITSVALKFRRVIATALVCALIGHLTAGDRIKINVRQSDEAIRQKLLEVTPVGTATEDVFRFAQSQLYRESRVVGWPPKYPGKRFGNFIYAELGHYYEAKDLFMLPTVVQAVWYFDNQDKLRDIRIRRFLRGM
jgi:hypothetical protein